MQRVAIVGAGKMGCTHSQAYAGIPNAEVVAICDARTESAEDLARRHSAQAFADLGQLLKEVDVDVVDVCTPTPAHLDSIRAAAAAGKNISCEKPLARSISQAMEAARICEEAGVVLFVAHVLRWFPEYKRLKQLIESGSIGDVVEVRTTRGGSSRPGVDSWFHNLQMSGGAVLDLLVHEFDWLRTCFGSVRRVYAKGLYNAHIPNIDYALVTLRFDNGVIAHVEGTWARPGGFIQSVEAAGTTGLLHYSNRESAPLAIASRSHDGECETDVLSENSAITDPYQLELEHFINCLEDGLTPDVTPQDGIEAVRIAEAALRSITTGEPVALA